ncbi:MAG: GYD domain-containing protein [Chloroflexi bacterium]|nr:GYD domain-containing protein [Chloroflexota bacterium]MYE40442.1 GYD domain-containing protein [Chloroflexota bacterium]
MPKYLFQANYTPEGMQGLLKEGGTSRRQVFEEMAKEQGGSLESFYYAFGGADLYMTFDLPDTATAAAISLSIGAGGALNITTVQLITPEEIDAACGKTVSYRLPGA